MFTDTTTTTYLLFLLSQQTHDVIRSHVEQRRTDRLQYPDRFDITPSIAEKALRRPPPQSTAYDDSNDHQVGTRVTEFIPKIK